MRLEKNFNPVRLYSAAKHRHIHGDKGNKGKETKECADVENRRTGENKINRIWQTNN